MTSDVPETKWQECQPGEVGQLVDRLRIRRRRKNIGRQAAILTSLLLAVGLGAYAWGTRSVRIGGITCDQVVANTAAFINEELDRATMGKIKLHLADCPQCRRHVEQARREADSPRGSQHRSSARPSLVGIAAPRTWLAATR